MQAFPGVSQAGGQARHGNPVWLAPRPGRAASLLARQGRLQAHCAAGNGALHGWLPVLQLAKITCCEHGVLKL